MMMPVTSSLGYEHQSENGTYPLSGNLDDINGTDKGIHGDPALSYTRLLSQMNQETNISNNTGLSSFPYVTSEESNVYMAWEDSSTADGNYEILFRKSTDNGQTFGDIINISNNTGSSINPQIGVSGNSVTIVWQDRSNVNSLDNNGLDTAGENNNDADTDTDYQVFFRKSTDNGQTFGDIINISNNTGNSNEPILVNTQGNISLVWESQSINGNNDILYRKSTDNGQTFGDIINISNNTGNSVDPKIAVHNNFVYVVWSDNSVGDYDIFFVSSGNHGDSFNSRVNLSKMVGNSLAPSLSVSGSNIYIAWRDFVTGNAVRAEILYTKSSDNGQTFSDLTNISNSDDRSIYPEIKAVGSNVYIIWEESDDRTSDVYFVRSTDNGEHFDEKFNLSNSRSVSSFSQLAVHDNKLYIIWSQEMLNPSLNKEYSAIFLVESYNEGASFTHAKKVSGNGENVFPTESANRHNVYIAWVKYAASGEGAGNSDIFFTKEI